MKRYSILLCVCLLALVTSCASDTREEIPASTIKSLFEEQLEAACDDQNYTEIQTGYFECNDEGERYVLRKLAAAGVIDYKAECFEVEETYRYSTGYDWWTGRTIYATGTRVNRHVFVDVTLTGKGKGFVVDEYPTPVEDEDPDLIEPKEKAYPEDEVEYYEVLVCGKKEEPKKQQPKKSYDDDEDGYDEEDEKEPAAVEEESAPAKAPELTPYEKACQNVFTENYIVETYAVEVVKARNIRLNQAEGTAEAEVIVETTNVTPFGRILRDAVDGVRDVEEVSLVFFEDKGWVLED